MRNIKNSFKYILTFVLVVILLTSLLVGVARIPRSMIKENVKVSAEFLCEEPLFKEVIKGVNGSRLDRYADSILLGIAYAYDENTPLESVMWSSYYYEKYQNANINLLEAVTQDLDANQQYLRYWHGSNVILRPLLIVFSLEQIYILHACILCILMIWMLYLLAKERAWILMIGLVTGLIMTNAWLVPFSLEYAWTYLLMFLASIICWKFDIAKKQTYFGICFLVIGMLTNFVDFLTTETLTLLVPLLFLIWREYNQKEIRATRQIVLDAVKWIIAWAFGYVGMWLMKWGIASVVLQENVMPYIAGHIAERTLGNVGLTGKFFVLETIRRNVSCLFPFTYGSLGGYVGLFLVIVVVYIGYVYHKKQLSYKKIFLYLQLGFIPFIRYVVLLNHSYIHAFFTYRAQLATILALVMILSEIVEWRWLIHAHERKGNP